MNSQAVLGEPSVQPTTNEKPPTSWSEYFLMVEVIVVGFCLLTLILSVYIFPVVDDYSHLYEFNLTTMENKSEISVTTEASTTQGVKVDTTKNIKRMVFKRDEISKISDKATKKGHKKDGEFLKVNKSQTVELSEVWKRPVGFDKEKTHSGAEEYTKGNRSKRSKNTDAMNLIEAGFIDVEKLPQEIYERILESPLITLLSSFLIVYPCTMACFTLILMALIAEVSKDPLHVKTKWSLSIICLILALIIFWTCVITILVQQYRVSLTATAIVSGIFIAIEISHIVVMWKKKLR